MYLGCCCLNTGEIIAYCSRMSRSMFILSCKCTRNFLCVFFVLKTASGLSVKCSDEFIFPMPNFDVA